MSTYRHLKVATHGHVTSLTLDRPPNNHIDQTVLAQLATVLEDLDADVTCRAVVLAANGRVFCAGADFSNSVAEGGERDPSPFYKEAIRLFRTRKPIVAAVQGAAIGAGLGLAVVADFRVTCATARFSANFNRLGFHPGFGLSVLLPRLVGQQTSAMMFYTGRRVGGTEAVQLGLADELAPDEQVFERALALAHEIAGSAPLAVQSTRETLRQDLADMVLEANTRELAIQKVQFKTADFKEGIDAMVQRRAPVFIGR